MGPTPEDHRLPEPRPKRSSVVVVIAATALMPLLVLALAPAPLTLWLPADGVGAVATDRRVQVVVWDRLDHDGDIVALSAGGVTRAVTLSGSPVVVELPVPPGGVLVVTGVRDGVGGITVAVESGGRVVPLPRLAEGQSLEVPLL
jgi:hypothetical protein